MVMVAQINLSVDRYTCRYRYIDSKIYQIVYLKSVQLTVWQLYLNKTVKKKEREKEVVMENISSTRGRHRTDPKMLPICYLNPDYYSAWYNYPNHCSPSQMPSYCHLLKHFLITCSKLYKFISVSRYQPPTQV